MATVYWWNDGIEADTWDNVNNWWTDTGHSTPNGAAPLNGDDVYFVGDKMPTAAPSGSVSLGIFDTNTYGTAGPWTGFASAATTSNITVNGALNFGRSGDTSVVVWFGGTFYGTTVFYGASRLAGPCAAVTVALEMRDSSMTDAGVMFNAVTGGTVYFYGTSSHTTSVTFGSQGASVAFEDYSSCVSDITGAGTVTFNDHSTMTGGTINVATLAFNSDQFISGGTITLINFSQSAGNIEGGDFTVSSTFATTGGTLGKADYTSGPSVNGSATLIMTIGADVTCLTATAVNTFTHSIGTIANTGAGSISIATVSATLNSGTMQQATITCSGSASISFGYNFNSNAYLTATADIFVASILDLKPANSGLVAGGSVVVGGQRQISSATYLKQGGILRLPDWTRGKNPFGGGPIF